MELLQWWNCFLCLMGNADKPKIKLSTWKTEEEKNTMEFTTWIRNSDANKRHRRVMATMGKDISASFFAWIFHGC